MAITTLTSREFNQNISKAKRATREGPVIITDRGNPAHVLITIEQYRELTTQQESVIDLLAMPGVEDINFEPPRVGHVSRTVDLA
ncbi:MAG: prevent-host-death family protein [Myxococcota bacterium]|jgi:prevent-host-death family protein